MGTRWNSSLPGGEVVEEELEIADIQCAVAVEVAELGGERGGVEGRDDTEKEENQCSENG